ncbi:uncharacterized protein Z518_02623 [Rhinocladiella mackenziei CBS 650.93]|uniref:Myb-like domain-containing protein n=1 Tax=Rhinocladiella mackenziei CBS 650.93 TaxID=1442369 RepID=A0A0D2IQ12_9EURO|nr:uncharacterized protein Z518_02623 [Rhinocladiella mackenziei CBS 650.93]KIX07969.1 hypothetical protein Z518_02623 [Rhinocladiella mackenziei CBS 650.93]
MATPTLPVPSVGSVSRSRRIQKTPNPSRRDKIRQGKLIRCWTDEEESFLFRSRNQKLPYKHIASRLEKSELACRLHYHHMTVGRKGHRAGEFDDDMSEESGIMSPPPVPAEGRSPSQKENESALPEDPILPAPDTTKLCTLPSFETFLRDTFHRRSLSMPDSDTHSDNMMPVSDVEGGTLLPSSNRPTRTLSGTWLRENRSLVVPFGPPPPSEQPGSESMPHGADLTRFHGISSDASDKCKLNTIPSMPVGPARLRVYAATD